jgi:hypothetical protein
MEDIFQPTIGNKSLQEIRNDNGFRVVNFYTSKNLTVESTMLSHRNHSVIGRRRHSSVLDIQSFRQQIVMLTMI